VAEAIPLQAAMAEAHLTEADPPTVADPRMAVAEADMGGNCAGSPQRR